MHNSNPSRHWSLEWAWQSGLWWCSMWDSYKGGEALSEERLQFWGNGGKQGPCWPSWPNLGHRIVMVLPGETFSGLGVGNFQGALATWCKEPTYWKRPSCWERLKAGRERGWQRIRWLNGIIDSMDMNLSKLWEIAKDREAWCAAVHGVTKGWTWLSDWTTILRAEQVFSEG